jgi:hypothetical protein
MQTSAASSYRWKSKDLERLQEEPFLSYEIIDGELIVSRKPHLRLCRDHRETMCPGISGC